MGATVIGHQTNDWELTIDEAGRLEELEGVITKVFVGFYVMGEALDEIDTKRLYRVTHVRFEDYCRDRFEIAKQTAYQYINAKKAFDNVRRGGQTKLLPLNERQVRPLTRLEPDAQVQAWEEVVKSAPFDGGITAKHVSEVVSELIGKKLTKKAEKITKDIEPVVSKEFSGVMWSLIDVVREEIKKPLKVKIKKIMIESLQRVEKLLED